MKFKVLIPTFLSILLCACTSTAPAAFPTESVPSPTEEGGSLGVDPSSIDEELAAVDQALGQLLQASFAYNAPESLQLDETGTIRLLLNPSASPQQLATQVAGDTGGEVRSGSLEITPRMKAELKARDENALQVRALHDSAEQVVAGTDTTKWEWWVTARKEGQQRMTLIVYRLVKYEGHEYWREVESYQSEIVINVTLAQRLQANWGWIAGLLAAVLLVPAGWWWAKHKKKDDDERADVTNIYVGDDVTGTLIVGDENDVKKE